jgi:DNA adenine methylase
MIEGVGTLDIVSATPNEETSIVPKPFLKWAGSKRSLLQHVLDVVPDKYGTYWEPFLGSGSLFFSLRPTDAILGDSCKPLVQTFRAVRDGPKAVGDKVRQLDITDENTYYKVRSDDASGSRFDQAARFIYLNRAGWSGLYRVNSKGRFNVPFGRACKNTDFDSANLRACAKSLKSEGVQLRTGDFEAILRKPKEGDLVFLDPPYVTSHNNNGFIEYNQKIFSWDDQVRLSKVAERLRIDGVHVVITNAAHEEILKLYPNFFYYEFERFSTLARIPEKRQIVSEIVLYTEP